MGDFNLEPHQLTVGEVHRNLARSALYEHAIRYEKDASIAENDAAAYDTTAKKLADLFRENFKKYESGVSAEIKAAGPV